MDLMIQLGGELDDDGRLDQPIVFKGYLHGWITDEPESLKELEAATGPSSSNLSCNLKTMARYGIVRMEKVRRNIRPVVEATDFTVQFGLYASSRHEHYAGGVRILRSAPLRYAQRRFTLMRLIPLRFVSSRSTPQKFLKYSDLDLQ
jgi:hypothetical protein